MTLFNLTRAPAALATKAAQIEWMPLLSFYGADPQNALYALFDLWQKGLRAWFLGFAVAAATGTGGRYALVVGLLIGTLLEGAQMLMLSHLPSVTDVIVFGVGAYGGGVVYTRYRTYRRRSQ